MIDAHSRVQKTLHAYRLEAMIQSWTNNGVPLPPNGISGIDRVEFFTVGKYHDRTLVIYMKKKGVSETINSSYAHLRTLLTT